MPGFIRLSGSSERLITRIVSMAAACSDLQAMDLAIADAMLAGAGAAHGERAIDHAVVDRWAARHLRRIVGVDQEDQMEIAVAHMADQGCDELCLRDILLGFQDAIGQP